MKILVLKCNTGEGHNSVAAAIQESARENGDVCDITDALSFLSERASEFICSWHVRLYRYAPKFYGSGYRLAEAHPSAFDPSSPVYKFLASGTGKLRAYIHAGGYDCVVCPHVIPSLMLTVMLSERPEPELVTCNIATDYTCSPMTGESGLDRYFVPDGSVVPEFVSAGVPENRIVVIDGIPVRREFYKKTEKKAARRALGIPEDGAHLLMMFGSMGCGPMQRLTELLDAAMPAGACATVVCGTNQELEHRLGRQYAGSGRIRVMGYAENVSGLMDSADLFLTKPGGISTSEAAVKGLPMALMDTVSACEEYNMRLFCARGGAVTADTPEELAYICRRLLEDPGKLKKMSKALMRRDNAADQVCRALREARREQEGTGT